MMKTANKRRFSVEQTAYMVAKAHRDELQEAATMIIGECTDWSDSGIDAYTERETTVHTDLGTLHAEQMLREAEQALLDWGVAQAKTSKKCTPAEAQLLDRLSKTPLIKYRQGAINLIMRLDVA